MTRFLMSACYYIIMYNMSIILELHSCFTLLYGSIILYGSSLGFVEIWTVIWDVKQLLIENLSQSCTLYEAVPNLINT